MFRKIQLETSTEGLLRKHHVSFTTFNYSHLLSSFGSLFALLHLYVSIHLSSGLLKVSCGVSSWPALPLQRSVRKTRPTTADVVRKKLRSCLPVRREWREILVRGLLQLHQRVLRYRPVQQCRVRYCPQLGGSDALPAACARAPAGLSSRRDDAVLSSIKKIFF